MVNQKVLSSESPKFKHAGGGKTEKQDYKGIQGTIRKKLGDCKDSQNKDGRLAMLIVGIDIRTTMKAPRFSR